MRRLRKAGFIIKLGGRAAAAGKDRAPERCPAMYLIELLLPLYRNDGSRQPQHLFAEVREEIVGRFGGLTAFTRSPAEGLWEDDGKRDADEIVIFEVMAEHLDRGWWRDYRRRLEARFQQEEIVVRAREVERL